MFASSLFKSNQTSHKSLSAFTCYIKQKLIHFCQISSAVYNDSPIFFDLPKSSAHEEHNV